MYPDALLLNERRNVFRTKAFGQGFFEVQDASSQLVAPFLQAEPGMRVIDACAGAGGKSLHLAAIMKNKGKIIALDTEQWKLKELRRRAKRNGVDIIEARDISSSKVIKRLHDKADRLLLDVPCSGLGVLKRNPDAKWKLQPEYIDNLKNIQANILSEYSAMLKPDGIMVYATCSILPGENQMQVERFLSENNNRFSLLEQKFISPAESGFDGFYMARIIRNA
jgi:16S rRNA (cytosine967-C5)-methyltransferase